MIKFSNAARFSRVELLGDSMLRTLRSDTKIKYFKPQLRSQNVQRVFKHI